MTLPAGIRLRPGESILSVTCHETAHSDGDDEYVKKYFDDDDDDDADDDGDVDGDGDGDGDDGDDTCQVDDSLPPCVLFCNVSRSGGTCITICMTIITMMALITMMIQMAMVTQMAMI